MFFVYDFPRRTSFAEIDLLLQLAAVILWAWHGWVKKKSHFSHTSTYTRTILLCISGVFFSIAKLQLYLVYFVYIGKFWVHIIRSFPNILHPKPINRWFQIDVGNNIIKHSLLYFMCNIDSKPFLVLNEKQILEDKNWT